MSTTSSLPRGCTFIGHKNTDVDSIASALACAELFNGKAARATQDLNGEIIYALEQFHTMAPDMYVDTPMVCLVDHNQSTQLADGLHESRLIGIIDHHALQSSTICTDVPIFVDIRPWGSTCTIITNLFLESEKTIPRNIAGLLLCGVLSDTLNLKSPTTTEYDRIMVEHLANLVGFQEQEDIDQLAKGLFKAKGKALVNLSTHALVMGDHKIFSLASSTGRNFQIGFGAIETDNPNAILARKDEVLFELKALRKELQLDFSLCVVVDSINLQSYAFVCGDSEREFMQKAFPALSDMGDDYMLSFVYNLPPGLISRKKDFIPAFAAVLRDGWTPSPHLAKKQTSEQEEATFGKVVVGGLPDDGHNHHGHEDDGVCHYCVPRRVVQVKVVVSAVRITLGIIKQIDTMRATKIRYRSRLLVLGGMAVLVGFKLSTKM